MSKVNLIRQGRAFAPATEQDEELLKRVRTGEIIACEFTSRAIRNSTTKFFALLNLAYEYWVPDGGLMPQQELFGITGLAKYIAAKMPGVDAQALAKEYVTMQITLADLKNTQQLKKTLNYSVSGLFPNQAIAS